VREGGGNRSAVIGNILGHYVGKENSKEYLNQYPTALSGLREYGLVKLKSLKHIIRDLINGTLQKLAYH